MGTKLSDATLRPEVNRKGPLGSFNTNWRRWRRERMEKRMAGEWGAGPGDAGSARNT